MQIILKVEQWMDWAKIIATSLRMQMKCTKEFHKDFYMASYLTYCSVCTCDLTPLPHEIWNEEMFIFQYCPLLQRDNVLEDFSKVHDVLLDNIYASLKKTQMPRLSPKAQRLVL